MVLRSFRLTGLVNLLGLPAAAVPVGVARGLPQGVQIIGDRYREDLCRKPPRRSRSGSVS